MRMRLRLLPVLIFSATCLLSIKVIDMADGFFVHVPTLTVGQTMAAGTPEDETMDAGDEQPAGDGVADAETDPAHGETAAGTPAEPTTIESVILALGDEPAYETPPLPLGDGTYESMGGEGTVYTPEELAVLQALGERRDEIEAREQDLEARERMLDVAEQRIDQKIAELAELQARIEALLAAYDEQEEEQLMSLVKVYETMRPKDAAVIFDQLEMDTLLAIISRMSNIRSAPILGRMDPLRAQEVTEELAARMQQRPDFMEQDAAQ